MFRRISPAPEPLSQNFKVTMQLLMLACTRNRSQETASTITQGKSSLFEKRFGAWETSVMDESLRWPTRSPEVYIRDLQWKAFHMNLKVIFICNSVTSNHICPASVDLELLSVSKS